MHITSITKHPESIIKYTKSIMQNMFTNIQLTIMHIVHGRWMYEMCE